MEWISGPDDNEVDIGFMPKMRLLGSASLPFEEELEVPQNFLKENHQLPEIEIPWDSEISETEALRKLEVKMYPFKKVRVLSIVVVKLYAAKK